MKVRDGLSERKANVQVEESGHQRQETPKPGMKTDAMSEEKPGIPSSAERSQPTDHFLPQHDFVEGCRGQARDVEFQRGGQTPRRSWL